MVINGYNMSTDVGSFLIAVLTLFLMFYTKPRRTRTFFLNVLGFIYSVLLIIVQRWILVQTSVPEDFNPILFQITCMIYYLLYVGILAVIFFYIVQLASNRNEIKHKAGMVTITITIIFNLIAVFLCFSGKMWLVTEQGRIMLSPWFYTYLVFGMLDACATLFVNICNRNKLSKFVLFFICIFVLVDLVILGVQMIQKTIFFTSLSYVIPFILFYLLFHSNPYDVNSGCQNAYSFETRFMECVRYHRKYMIIYVVFPALKNELNSYSDDDIDLALSQECRKVERLSSGLHLYSMSNATYAMVVQGKNRQKQMEIFQKLQELFEEPISIHNYKVNLRYKMVGFFDHKSVNSIAKKKAMVRFLLNKLDSDLICQSYFCKEEDYTDYEQQYEIYQMLIDIRERNDLNDERVLCYAQPIYSIEKDSFRTAEALMRLSLNGTIIYPDRFISLAEENNCVHVLTCIMLNKVCQYISELEKTHEVEAITINCSTLEFVNPNLHGEIIQIIRQNHVLNGKIRLELTESAMYTDYETILYNMNQLKENGVEFYLDDFGTGYSNLERIASCPFNTVKFDKSLLYKAINDKNLNALMKSMVQVFKNQGLNLVIEGVENDEQKDYSIDQGFDYIQGYHFAKPVPIEKLVDYFEKR